MYFQNKLQKKIHFIKPVKSCKENIFYYFDEKLELIHQMNFFFLNNYPRNFDSQITIV